MKTPDKALSMTEFVLWLDKIFDFAKCGLNQVHILDIVNYAKHLQRSLELGMFIPCKDGKPLEKPKDCDALIKSLKLNHAISMSGKEFKKCIEYQQAVENVIFDYTKEDAFYQAEKWIAIYDTIEDYIREEKPAITDNFYRYIIK